MYSKIVVLSLVTEKHVLISPFRCGQLRDEIDLCDKLLFSTLTLGLISSVDVEEPFAYLNFR